MIDETLLCHHSTAIWFQLCNERVHFFSSYSLWIVFIVIILSQHYFFFVKHGKWQDHVWNQLLGSKVWSGRTLVNSIYYVLGIFHFVYYLSFYKFCAWLNFDHLYALFVHSWKLFFYVSEVISLVLMTHDFYPCLFCLLWSFIL